MAKYILSFPFHPDRFNPGSVEQRIALIAAFKQAREAKPCIYYGPDGGLFEAEGEERDLAKCSDFEMFIVAPEPERGPSFVGVPVGE